MDDTHICEKCKFWASDNYTGVGFHLGFCACEPVKRMLEQASDRTTLPPMFMSWPNFGCQFWEER